MKVALIGNMNNNNFSIMRYLRDLGVDAHLILMINDYTKSQTHFAPEYDTWQIDKWTPYIHYIDFKDWEGLLVKSKRRVRREFIAYDILIGSGYIPSLMNKCGLRLDIFYPYGAGIEGVGAESFRNGNKVKPVFKRIILNYLKNCQIKGIRNARLCINSELSLTKQTFDEIGVKFEKVPVPMLYNKEVADESKLTENMKTIINMILPYKYRFFCHVSHVAVKDNEPYIKGYAKYIKNTESSDTILILFEYGTTLQQSKQLIEQLGISDKVLWLPKMSRKEIMYLLGFVDFGFGEFQGIMWGGTGWEFSSKGIPFFHYYNITEEKFIEEYNKPILPFINTNSPDIICEHLINYRNDSAPYKLRGAEMKKWFENYGGLGLAKEWKMIIETIYLKKTNETH
jgi:hypothetical protein